MIGNPENMEDPTGAATQRAAGTVTAAMLIQEAWRRRQAQKADADATAARLRAESAKVADGKTTTVAAPDRDTLLRQWEQANARGKAGAGGMREAERILTHTEPELMARYTELTRDGQKPGEAMATAMRETKPNPDPPSRVPAAGGWDDTPAAAGSDNTAGGAWNTLRQLLARNKRKGPQAA